MFNPEFDPLKDLYELQKRTGDINRSIMEMAKAFNDRAGVLEQIITALNNQHATIQELNNRIQLLEMARQNEKN